MTRWKEVHNSTASVQATWGKTESTCTRSMLGSSSLNLAPAWVKKEMKKKRTQALDTWEYMLHNVCTLTRQSNQKTIKELAVACTCSLYFFFFLFTTFSPVIWSAVVDRDFLFHCPFCIAKVMAVSKWLTVKRRMKTEFCPSSVVFREVPLFRVRGVHSISLTAAGNPVTSMVQRSFSVIYKQVRSSIVSCLPQPPVTLTSPWSDETNRG